MKLRYLGHEPGGAIPLPEGWPAFDHEETSLEVASEKIASGKYEAFTDKKVQLPVVNSPSHAVSTQTTIDDADQPEFTHLDADSQVEKPSAEEGGN